MRFSELDHATVGVWGAGREIRSFAAHLARRLPSARLAVVASDEPLDRAERASLVAPNAHFATGPAIGQTLAGCDVIVRSPGVSIYKPELLELSRGGVPVTTATALWLEEHGSDRVIGVTGTKGKSTTAAVLAHLGRAAGARVALAGNIGVPALDLLDEAEPEVIVVELSSYQIADLPLGPQVAVFTNLYPEHVDWHRTHEAYMRDKLRLLTLPGVRTTVLNAREPLVAAKASSDPRAVLYGTPSGWDASPDGIHRHGDLAIPAEKVPLAGEHNALNICAAAAALETVGIDPVPRSDVLTGFKPLAHRLELVAQRGGTKWVDDSISTTPESTLAALKSFDGAGVVLIGGGHDRGQDYTELGRVLAELDLAVIGLPVTGARLIAAARAAGVPSAKAVEAPDMDKAVESARRLTQPGGVVLLSPAAPSYGAYRDFIERGNHFRELVSEVPLGDIGREKHP